MTCQASSPSTCTACNSGFYLDSGSCVACPSFCSACNSATFCTALVETSGYVLVQVNATYTALGKCDYGCMTCSDTNPGSCSSCYNGFYLKTTATSSATSTTASSICTPCTTSSKCQTCNSASPAVCTSCYPGSFLSNSVCVTCTSPCITCLETDLTACQSCPSGYMLNGTSCTEITTTTATTACNDNCANCQVVSGSAECLLCRDGYVLNENSVCTPCTTGCSVCSPGNFSLCLGCAQGNYLNTVGNCVACSSNCLTCSSLGCSQCKFGYSLHSDATCVETCQWPCATCETGAPSTCLSCLYGWTMSSTTANTCETNVSTCNTAQDCDYCPYAYTLVSASTTSTRSVTCSSCSSSNNCQRCLQSNTATCTSCNAGWYLNSQSQCVSCDNNGNGCARCISLSLCFVCQTGYVAKQVAKLTTATATASAISSNPVTCEACTSPCATCSGDTTNCLTCIDGYTFKGTKCVSDFNFQLSVVLGVTTAVFNSKYLEFVSDIADALSTTVDKISVISLRYGSVSAVVQASTTNAPNSQAAINQQNALTNAANSGSLGGMAVSSSSVTTNGGSNNSGSDDDSGLSRTTIIILAVCIPCGVLRKSVFIQSLWVSS